MRALTQIMPLQWGNVVETSLLAIVGETGMGKTFHLENFLIFSVTIIQIPPRKL